MATEAEYRRVLLAGQAQTEQVRRQVAQFVSASWLALGSWRDAEVAAWVRAVTPAVLAGQRQISMLTIAQLVATARLAGAEVTVPAIPANEITVAELRGVPVADVYRRPAVTTWTGLSNGLTLDEAVERGARRAVNLAVTDLQLAKTHTAQRVIAADDQVVGYRRVLTGFESCGLCAVASTQRYRKGDLMPIHPGCDCGVAPIYGAEDPGHIINAERLDATHDVIRETFGAYSEGAREIRGAVDPVNYRDALVTHAHGEIGPVIGVRGQRFTGPDDLDL